LGPGRVREAEARAVRRHAHAHSQSAFGVGIGVGNGSPHSTFPHESDNDDNDNDFTMRCKAEYWHRHWGRSLLQWTEVDMERCEIFQKHVKVCSHTSQTRRQHCSLMYMFTRTLRKRDVNIPS
jgi:hypothetical protein